MRLKMFSILAMAGMMQLACAKKEESKDATDQTQGTPIDSTVVGKDSNSVDTRKDIDKNDAEKLTVPGTDTTNTDVPRH